VATYFDIHSAPAGHPRRLFAAVGPQAPGPQVENLIAPTAAEQVARVGLDFQQLLDQLPSAKRKTFRRRVESKIVELEARIAASIAAQAGSTYR